MTKLKITPEDLEELKDSKNRFSILARINNLRCENEKLRQENLRALDLITNLQKELESYRKNE